MRDGGIFQSTQGNLAALIVLDASYPLVTAVGSARGRVRGRRQVGDVDPPASDGRDRDRERMVIDPYHSGVRWRRNEFLTEKPMHLAASRR